MLASYDLMSIKLYKPLRTKCFVTELMFECTVPIQNRSKIYIMVLTSSIFFRLWTETGQTEFFVSCVMKGEDAKDLAELQINMLQLLFQGCPQRGQVFQNSWSFEIFFLRKIRCFACVFNSFILLKILCLAKREVNFVCSCSHRLLSLTESRLTQCQSKH